MKKVVLILSVISLLMFSVESCKKPADNETILTDSIQIVKSGGIAGISKNYVITHSSIMKITTTARETLSNADHKITEHLLYLPERMIKENNYDYGNSRVWNDGIQYMITAYRDCNTYNWTMDANIDNVPTYVKPYGKKLERSFSLLEN